MPPLHSLRTLEVDGVLCSVVHMDDIRKLRGRGLPLTLSACGMCPRYSKCDNPHSTCPAGRENVLVKAETAVLLRMGLSP